MTSINLDLEAAAKAVTQRLEDSLPPAIDRARKDLRDVLSADLSVQEFVAYVLALSQAKDYVADSLTAIKVSDVLGASKAPKPAKKVAKKPKPTDTDGEQQAGIATVIDVIMANSKAPVSKLELQKQAAEQRIEAEAFNAAWQVLRKRYQSVGAGIATRYTAKAQG